MEEHLSPLEKLKTIAEWLAVPYDVHEYKGNADEFCVYEANEVSPELFADNHARHHVATVKLHYILPAGKGYWGILWNINDYMIALGFTDPIVVIETDNKKTVLKFTSEISI